MSHTPHAVILRNMLFRGGGEKGGKNSSSAPIILTSPPFFLFRQAAQQLNHMIAKLSLVHYLEGLIHRNINNL